MEFTMQSNITKLTDLNFDCLESILEYLELIDLLNVADCNKRLQKAAELVYAYKYGDKTVLFSNRPTDRLIRVVDKYIEITDLKVSLRFLRCVGCEISKIEIRKRGRWKKNIEDQYKLFKYINKYCAEHLEEMKLLKTKFVVDSNNFNQPFKSLVRLNIVDYDFSKKISVANFFPKLNYLIYSNFKNASLFNINTDYFSALTTLVIHQTHLNNSFRNENVLPFLELNPQLRTLALVSAAPNLNTNLIRSAVHSLQNISILHIDMDAITGTKETDHFIYMKSMKIFRINFENFNKLPVCYLPFGFEHLEKFRVYFPRSEFHSAFEEEFFNFIDKNSTIVHLQIGGVDWPWMINWSRLATSLPLLRFIKLDDCWLTTDEAIELLTKFEFLSTFCFKLKDEYDRFRIQLSEKWHGKYKMDTKFIELKKICQ